MRRRVRPQRSIRCGCPAMLARGGPVGNSGHPWPSNTPPLLPPRAALLGSPHGAFPGVGILPTAEQDVNVLHVCHFNKAPRGPLSTSGHKRTVRSLLQIGHSRAIETNLIRLQVGTKRSLYEVALSTAYLAQPDIPIAYRQPHCHRQLLSPRNRIGPSYSCEIALWLCLVPPKSNVSIQLLQTKWNGPKRESLCERWPPCR